MASSVLKPLQQPIDFKCSASESYLLAVSQFKAGLTSHTAKVPSARLTH